MLNLNLILSLSLKILTLISLKMLFGPNLIVFSHLVNHNQTFNHVNIMDKNKSINYIINVNHTLLNTSKSLHNLILSINSLNSNAFMVFKPPLHRIKRELDLSDYQISQRQGVDKPTRKTSHLSQVNKRPQSESPSKQAFKHNAAPKPPGKVMVKRTTKRPIKIGPHLTPKPLNKTLKRHPVLLEHPVVTKPTKFKQQKLPSSVAKSTDLRASPKSSTRRTTKVPSHSVTKSNLKLSGQPKATVVSKKATISKTVFTTQPTIKPKIAPKPLYRVPFKQPKTAATYKTMAPYKPTTLYKPVASFKPLPLLKQVTSYKPAALPYYKPLPTIKYTTRPPMLFSKKPVAPLFVQPLPIVPTVKRLNLPQVRPSVVSAPQTLLKPKLAPYFLAAYKPTHKRVPSTTFLMPSPIEQVPLEFYPKTTFRPRYKQVYASTISKPVIIHPSPPVKYSKTTFRPLSKKTYTPILGSVPIQKMPLLLYSTTPVRPFRHKAYLPPVSTPASLQRPPISSLAITSKPRLKIVNLFSTMSVPTVLSVYKKAVTLPILTPTSTSLSTAVLSTTVPSTTVPFTTVPSTTVPSTTVPSTTVPSTTVPSTTVPSTTVPFTTVPSTTVPSTTVPSTTVPSTTVPSTTVPSTTFSYTTVKSTTFPFTTVPPTTVPSTTVPFTTVPSTTVPSTTFSYTTVKSITAILQAPTTLRIQRYSPKTKATFYKTKLRNIGRLQKSEGTDVSSQYLYPRPLCPPNIMYSYPYPCLFLLSTPQLTYMTEKPTLTTSNFVTSSKCTTTSEKPTTSTPTQAAWETAKKVEKCITSQPKETYKPLTTTETIKATSVIDYYSSNQCNTTCKPNLPSKLVIGVYLN